MLQHVHNADNLIFNGANRANVLVNQKHLGNLLVELFPNEKIVEKSRNFIFKESGFRLELDFWLPALKLAFEFQGPHHYTNAWYSPFSRERWEGHDNIKKQITNEEGVTIVEVPYWWEGDKGSLITTIRERRKDLLPELEGASPPIPNDAATFGSYKPSTVPDVGELMNVNFVPSKSFTLTSWWISEKYDGVRACWNCIKNKLYGRTGRDIGLSDLFTVHFPRLFLDGEIWFGRVSFKESHAVTVHSHHADAPRPPLQFFRFVVFDSPPPSAPLSAPDSSFESPLVLSSAVDSPFEARSLLVDNCVPRTHPFILTIANTKCISKLQLRGILDDVWKTEGEGLVLRGPKSLYTKGNSDDIVKLKAFRDDEGLVTHVGKYHVALQQSDGATFHTKKYLGMPKVETGDVVTYTYLLSINGNFRNPKILRKRPDLRWDDLVCRERHNDTHRGKVSPHTSHYHYVKKGHFTSDDGKNIRIFFEDFAAARNFDPLVAENWYTAFNFYDFMREKGGAAVLSLYKNSWARAIIGTFPDIGLDITQFKKVPQNYWKDVNNQRDFFIGFAKKRGFDPLVAENWYNISHSEYKKVHKMTSLFASSICRILQTVFPDIRLDPLKFSGSVHWRSWPNRRRFFDSLAEQYGFDPLVVANWYESEKQITSKIMSIGRGRGMFERFYRCSLRKALQDLYINNTTS